MNLLNNRIVAAGSTPTALKSVLILLCAIILYGCSAFYNTASVKVVDEHGNPIAGAKVFGTQAHTQSITLTRYESFSGFTDESGYFEIPAENGINMRVAVDGYYVEFVKFFTGSNAEEYARKFEHDHAVSEGTVVVQLEPEDPRVPIMHGPEPVGHKWEEFQKHYEAGLKFLHDPQDYVNPVFEREEADVWFTFEHSGDRKMDFERASDYGKVIGYNTRHWTVTITGLNGWKLLPAPGDRYTKYEDMRVAPESGYQESVAFSANLEPRNYWLSQDNGKRYGKLTHFEFADEYVGDLRPRNGVYFKVRYYVQEKPSGTRSLNPVKVNKPRPYYPPKEEREKRKKERVEL